MKKDIRISIEEIYVPTKRRGTLDDSRVEELAGSILEEGQQVPISVRPDPAKKRYVLVEGLHRLEACRALGESEITAVVVQARQH